MGGNRRGEEAPCLSSSAVGSAPKPVMPADGNRPAGSTHNGASIALASPAPSGLCVGLAIDQPCCRAKAGRAVWAARLLSSCRTIPLVMACCARSRRSATLPGPSSSTGLRRAASTPFAAAEAVTRRGRVRARGETRTQPGNWKSATEFSRTEISALLPYACSKTRCQPRHLSTNRLNLA